MIISGSTILTTAFFIIIIVAVLMILDFFGVNVTDDYVEGNMEYAEDYLNTLNNNIEYGYVSLNRILYFSVSSQTISYDQIYIDNVDSALKQVKPISDVCILPSYKILDGCKTIDSNQIDAIQIKLFAKPVDFENMTITSFYMQERIVFDTYDIHYGWDFALAEDSPVYAVCDGIIIEQSFEYIENVTDTSGGYGNKITLECEIEGDTYEIIYAHLYPCSDLFNVGDYVEKGEQISSVGTTGYSTGNHLHFEVRKNDVLIDGMSLIDFNFERVVYEESDIYS